MLIGLFDSGSGGLNTVRYIKESAKDVDLRYVIDRNNAPYGIKSEKELIEISEANIAYLTDMGCERVLIACCTASTVHGKLKEKYKKASIPIIDAVAKAARRASPNGRIGVIATNYTVSSHAFGNALGECTRELSLSDLVEMIDCGLSDRTVTENDVITLEKMLLPILQKNIDTLILGCTHFSSVRKTVSYIAKRYGVTNIIDSAKEGALLLADTSDKRTRNK